VTFCAEGDCLFSIFSLVFLIMVEDEAMMGELSNSSRKLGQLSERSVWGVTLKHVFSKLGCENGREVDGNSWE